MKLPFSPTLLFLAASFFINAVRAEDLLGRLQSAEPSLAYTWVFHGTPGAQVEAIHDTVETIELVPYSCDNGGFATLTKGVPGSGLAIAIPAPASQKEGAGLRSKKLINWPREGTVEFLACLQDSGLPTTGMIISGLSLETEKSTGNRWFVAQKRPGDPLIWVVGSNGDFREMPVLVGGASPVPLENNAWYYFALQYRFEANSTCRLRAFVARLGEKTPRLEKVAEISVPASTREGCEPLLSLINVGVNGNNAAFGWQGSVANLAFYREWLPEESLANHLRSLHP